MERRSNDIKPDLNQLNSKFYIKPSYEKLEELNQKLIFENSELKSKILAFEACSKLSSDENQDLRKKLRDTSIELHKVKSNHDSQVQLDLEYPVEENFVDLTQEISDEICENVESPQFKTFKCKRCLKIYKRKKLYMKHLKTHKSKPNEIYKCQVFGCNYSSPYKHCLGRHKNSHKNQVEITSTINLNKHSLTEVENNVETIFEPQFIVLSNYEESNERRSNLRQSI